MADLTTLITQKTRADEMWKLQKQTEREDTVALRDGAIADITSSADNYAAYLQLQGNNPTYSAGNVALAMYQLKDVTIIGTKERWASLGRTVLRQEEPNGAKIFVRPNPTQRRGYSISDAYDISQTQGKPYRQPQMLPDTPQMERALSTLLNYAPCPVVADGDLSEAAWYNPKSMELIVNPMADDKTAFYAIATEIVQARFHNKGANQYYDKDECRLDAESVAYLICRRVGLDQPLPDTTDVAALYDGFEVEQRTDALNRIQSMAKQIGGAIERNMQPPQRNRGNYTMPVS